MPSIIAQDEFREPGKLTNTIKLTRKYLQHNQSEAELAETSPNVSAFKSTLCGSNLHQFFGGQHDGPLAVGTQTVA